MLIVCLIDDLTTYTYKYPFEELDLKKMSEGIPKHLQNKYSLLYNEFNDNEFRFQDAIRVLGKGNRYTAMILSKLWKAGWISKRTDKNDGRIKYYRLNDPAETIKKISKKD